jgi:DNA-binding response OmpR family regulator
MMLWVQLLLIEDDRAQAGLVCKRLAKKGHTVEWAHDGTSGLAMAATRAHDVVMLDLLLPDMDGFAVLQKFRAEDASTPVLVLSAVSTVDHRVKALNAGADDYLVKPFSFEELEARLDALTRRAKTPPPQKEIVVADLRLDLLLRCAFRGSRKIRLTRREFDLLELFMRNPDTVLTRRTIWERLWDPQMTLESNVIDVFVRHLRKKIEAGSDLRFLHTVKGQGYRFGLR